MAEPQIRYCTTTDGVSIAYYTMGDGETMLIASNVLWSNTRFAPIMTPEYHRTGKGLGRGMRVVRYDGRGAGMSDRRALDFSLEARLRDIDAVVAKIGAPTFTLVAGAHAAMAAVEYAARHPDRVTKLVLSAPVVDGSVFRDATRKWDSLRAMAAEEWKTFTDTMAATAIGHEHPDLLRELAERMRESMEPAAVQAFYAATIPCDVRDSLSKLTMPVLLLFRESGNRVVTAEDVRRYAAIIPDCELRESRGDPGDLWSDEDTAAVERFLGVAPAASIARDAAVQPSAPVRSPATGLQTIVFTDIEANTELLQRVGDAAWRDILREHERTTRALLAEHGGTEIKTIGDAFMTSFGSASAAIECAIDLQREFRREAEHPHGPLRIRIGINAGEPIAEADDLFGTAVTTAARVQSMAKGGEILVTDVVRQLVAGKGFLFDDRGEHTLRGFEDPVRIFAVRIGD